MTAIVRGGKWSLLEPHSLSIGLLDWTIKQKRQNRNNGKCVRICSKFSVKCEASRFYAVRAGTEQENCKIINNAVETLTQIKKKKQYVGF